MAGTRLQRLACPCESGAPCGGRVTSDRCRKEPKGSMDDELTIGCVGVVFGASKSKKCRAEQTTVWHLDGQTRLQGARTLHSHNNNNNQSHYGTTMQE